MLTEFIRVGAVIGQSSKQVNVHILRTLKMALEQGDLPKKEGDPMYEEMKQLTADIIPSMKSSDPALSIISLACAQIVFEKDLGYFGTHGHSNDTSVIVTRAVRLTLRNDNDAVSNQACETVAAYCDRSDNMNAVLNRINLLKGDGFGRLEWNNESREDGYNSSAIMLLARILDKQGDKAGLAPDYMSALFEDAPSVYRKPVIALTKAYCKTQSAWAVDTFLKKVLLDEPSLPTDDLEEKNIEIILSCTEGLKERKEDFPLSAHNVYKAFRHNDKRLHSAATEMAIAFCQTQKEGEVGDFLTNLNRYIDGFAGREGDVINVLHAAKEAGCGQDIGISTLSFIKSAQVAASTSHETTTKCRSIMGHLVKKGTLAQQDVVCCNRTARKIVKGLNSLIPKP